jgi:aryl-alcohol dehydrogenase-like predicted oxidoreductase
MQIRRREFLKRSALGVAGVMAGSRWGSAAQPAARHFDPFEKVALGKSGLKVPRFCLGTGMGGGQRQSNQTRLGQKKFTELARGAHERGIRLFDAADLYGSHPYLASALKGLARDDYLLISKIWWMRGGIPERERPDADVVVARFLKELQTDYIDLLLLHCVTSSQWPQELRRQMDLMAKLKEKGVVRALGVSCHSLKALEAALAEPWVDSVHARINPYGIAMDGAANEVLPVLKKLQAAGKGIVGMKLIGAGALRDEEERRDASVRYALQSGCVDVLNVGCESLAEVDDFAARVRKVPEAAAGGTS